MAPKSTVLSNEIAACLFWAGLSRLNCHTGAHQKKSEMEARVSNVEICNLAYGGKFEELKKCVLSDSSLATKTDQVSGSSCCTCMMVSMLLWWSVSMHSMTAQRCVKVL